MDATFSFLVEFSPSQMGADNNQSSQRECYKYWLRMTVGKSS